MLAATGAIGNVVNNIRAGDNIWATNAETGPQEEKGSYRATPVALSCHSDERRKRSRNSQK